MTPDQTAGHIRSHIAELRDRDAIEDVELPRYRSIQRARRHVDDLGNEIVKPKHVKESEERIRHGLERLIIAETGKHLPSENGQQEEEQDCQFEVVGTRRTDFSEI